MSNMENYISISVRFYVTCKVFSKKKKKFFFFILDFSHGPGVGSLPGSVGDVGLIPGLGGFHVPRSN